MTSLVLERSTKNSQSWVSLFIHYHRLTLVKCIHYRSYIIVHTLSYRVYIILHTLSYYTHCFHYRIAKLGL